MPRHDRSGPTAGPLRFSSDDLVVLGMRADPEPHDSVCRLDPESAVPDTDSRRIEPPDPLKVQRRMTLIALQLLVATIRKALDSGW